MKSLYRIHRPKKFDEVKGQSEIVEVLKQSIKKNNLNHAYLFSGSRGTGKTSVARILAKEIKCDDLDIIEIDAASQNSVENVRELSDMVRTVPLKSDYKVYILDEVHMFSKSAFNAFLKILEEPPIHTIFMLATTEIDKVPKTIISRCQNFTFKRPTLPVLEETIKEVAKKEGYKVDISVVAVIALLSDGSFRDALGILQKLVIASTSKNITREEMQNILGVPTSESVNEYLVAFSEKDVKTGIKVVENIAKENADMDIFLKLTLRKVRSILLYRFTKNEDLLNDYDDTDKEFIKNEAQKKGIDLDVLNALLSIVSTIKVSYIPELPLEMILIKHSMGEK